MISLSICTQSSQCCILAMALVPPNNGSQPVRAFVGVGVNCQSSPPINSPTGSPSAPWVEASSIAPTGNGDFQVAFPGFGPSDPRCVTPCYATYTVCVWALHADGSYSCSEETINPSDFCQNQPLGCTECASDDGP